MPGGADRTVTVTLMARVSQFVSAMASAGSTVKALGAEMDKATSTEKGRTNLNKMSTTMAGFGAVMTGVAAGAVVLSAQFEAAMSKVKSNVDDKTAPAMKRLSAAAIQAGKDTQYSATEAADAEDELAKAGISAKDIYGGALTGALSLAAAGQLDVGSAAEIAASAMNNFKLTGQDIPHVADLLAAGADKAQGSVQDLGEALKYVGPIAGQMGISIEQTVGVLTELASQGILGSQAGTSLRGVLSSLTSPSMQAKQVMQQLGITMYDSSGKFAGLANLAGQLHTKMSGLTNAQRDNYLGMIFGNQQLTAARVLYDQGAAGVDKFTKMVNDQGFAAQSAHTKMDNLNGDLKKLKSSLETDLIQAGSGANSSLRGLTQGLTGVVNAFGSLPKGLQSATVYIAAAVGGLALLGAGFVKARTGIAAFQDQLSAMGPAGEKAAGVVGKITSAVGKFAGVATLAVIGFELLAAGANALAGEFNKPLPSVNALASSLEQLTHAQVVSGDAAKVIGPNFEQLRDDITKIGPAATSADSALASADSTITSLFDHIGVHSLSAAAMMGASWVAVLGPTDAAKNRIGDLDKALTSLVTSGHADMAQQLLVNMANGAGVGVDELTARFPKLTAALDAAQSSASQAQGPMANLSQSMNGDALATQSAADATANFVDQIHQINDPALADFEATTNFAESLGTLKTTLDASGFSLDEHTTKGQAFRDAAAKAGRAALDLVDAEGKEKVGTDAAAKALDSTRASLIATLTPYAGSKAAAQAFVDTVLKIPTSKATNISAPGAQTSADAVWNAVNAVNALHDQSFTITEYIKYLTVPGSGNATVPKGGYGGLLGQGLDNRWGGVYVHAAATGLLRQATLAPAGGRPLYQWAEPSTGGEGFVPRFGEPNRSRQIIETEAGWYGGTVMWANGSAVPYGSVGGGGYGGTGGGGGPIGQQVAAGLAPLLMAMVSAIEAGRTISVQVGQQELVRAYDEGKRITNYVG
jgi:TP901 family phage tail tape measure protein